MMRFVEIQYGSELYDQELKLRNALLRRPLGLAITERDIEQDATQMHFGIVVEDAKREPKTLIACVVVINLGNNHAKLRQMAVAVDHQRRGIGSTLIRETESHLRELGFESLELNAREPVIPFYQQLGYAPRGERFVEVTIAHQQMYREL